jgi:uncharacterized OsmC-like protein
MLRKTKMTSALVYLGGLRTEATHLASGTKVQFDAPIDNHGKGEAFSPTDMVATSLGTCMMTLMGIAANAHGIKMEGTKANILKVMGAAPRKIAEIRIVFEFPANEYSSKDKKILQNAALTCPVALSLHPELLQNITFQW